MTTIFGANAMKTLAIEGAKAVALAGANGVASWAAAPWPINMGAPAFGKAMAAAAKLHVSSAKVSGALHGGLDNVPNEATYLLQRGERVLSPNQNTDLTTFLEKQNGGGGGANIENVSIVINTTAENFADIDENELTEFVADKIIPTLNRLDDNGVRQKALERG